MINASNKRYMYDMFIDKNSLTTQELLECGFTNKDLTRLIESGIIKRVKRGVYELVNIGGLFNYAQSLCKKNKALYTRATQGFKKCIEYEPNNGLFHTRVFLNSIMDGDYEEAFKSLAGREVVPDGDYIIQDDNLWLFMLQFVTELPEKYKERVNNLKLSDVLLLDDDDRFSDVALQNDIRKMIFNRKFMQAHYICKNQVVSKDKLMGFIILDVVLNSIMIKHRNSFNPVYDLIMEEDYEKAISLLEEITLLYEMNYVDENYLIVLRDLVGMRNDNKIPVINKKKKIVNFHDALVAHNYEKAFEIWEAYDGKKNADHNKFMGILLERVNYELERIKEKDSIKALEEKEVEKNVKVDPIDLYASITTSLIMQDVDKALSLLGEYLSLIGKEKFSGYVADIVKLCVAKNELCFIEPILLLYSLSKDEFQFNVANYIQDFCLSIYNKHFKEAVIYLDILSMSKELVGIDIPTDVLEKKLIEEASLVGISKDELGINSNHTETPKLDNGSVKDNDKLDITYSLADTFNDILTGVNMVMLEPMCDEEIAFVVDLASKTDKIKPVVIEDVEQKKRVVLRYLDKNSPYINISKILKIAERKYFNCEYESVIELYQSILPKLDEPRSFIFERLGYCYSKNVCDGDYLKAIDYYTMAMAQSRNESKFCDFTDVINELKTKTKYNGVKIEKTVQYSKKGE